jgi:hypothetical protein
LEVDDEDKDEDDDDQLFKSLVFGLRLIRPAAATAAFVVVDDGQLECDNDNDDDGDALLLLFKRTRSSS